MDGNEQVRGEIVAALTRTPTRLPTDWADALLDANDRERAFASRVLLAEVLAEAGILRPSTVLDLTLRQVQGLAAAFGVLASWWPQPALERRPMGDVVKVIPEGEARYVLQLLVWGRLDPRDPHHRTRRAGAGPGVAPGVNVALGAVLRSYRPRERRQMLTGLPAPGLPVARHRAPAAPPPPVLPVDRPHPVRLEVVGCLKPTGRVNHR